MFNKEQFKQQASNFSDWITDYLENVDKFPVRSNCNYGDIKNNLPDNPPDEGEKMDDIFSDFKSIILPGISHWQSPKFFAYFPANSSEPSLLAEYLTAALGVQGMKWITSPAATELEERVMEWLRKMIGLSANFTGVIQDTASVSTLSAILAAREKITGNESNEKGIYGQRLRVYCSFEAHSSIEKAVRIAGIGSANLVKIPVDSECRMIPEKLEAAIKDDLRKAYRPACIVGALGTTGTCAVDPIREIGGIAEKYKIWFHIDAAFAGTALILPEYRDTIPGLELADSFVFNPHKWMFTNFDCSAFFVKDPEQLQKTFLLVPSYLQTENDQHSKDYSNWGIQLGRRFRSLKLWFVIRNFGVNGIQERLRTHLRLAGIFENWIENHTKFELLVPRSLVVTCFRFFNPDKTEEELNRLNKALLENINATGKVYISHTFVENKFALRFVCAQTDTAEKHIDEAIQVIDHCLSKI